MAKDCDIRRSLPTSYKYKMACVRTKIEKWDSLTDYNLSETKRRRESEGLQPCAML